MGYAHPGFYTNEMVIALSNGEGLLIMNSKGNKHTHTHTIDKTIFRLD